MNVIDLEVMRTELRNEYNRKMEDVRRICSELEELLDRYRTLIEEEHNKNKEKSLLDEEG